MSDWLAQIVRDKHAELAARRGPFRTPPAPWRGIPFSHAIRAAPVGIIAEVKHRSPSAGVLREPWDPVAIARAYVDNGAQAISVLVDERYFGGGVGDLCAVRAAVHVPLLYKEFVVDPWQIEEAAHVGAAAVLLIVAALDDVLFRDLLSTARSLGLDALVEVHDEEELDRALDAGADVIGINNRDLRTFRVSLETTARLAPRIPPSRTIVSESGIRSSADVRRLCETGVHAILVGESFVRSPDPGAVLRQWREELKGAKQA